MRLRNLPSNHPRMFFSVYGGTQTKREVIIDKIGLKVIARLQSKVANILLRRENPLSDSLRLTDEIVRFRVSLHHDIGVLEV